MTENWKPGDIAIAGGPSEFVVFCYDADSDGRGHLRWMYGDGSNAAVGDRHMRNCRPLITIDSAKLEGGTLLPQWIRYAALDMERDSTGPVIRDLRTIADAIEATFAEPTPPKPEEPNGLGAVVEAINDNHFVRVGSAGWVHVDDCAGEPCDWRDIAVIRVLSEGVTP